MNNKQTAKEKMELLKGNICELLFEFKDGSRVVKVSTLNKELLEELGLASKGSSIHLIDLNTEEEIPNSYVPFIKRVEIYQENESRFSLCELDQFISKGLFRRC